MKWLPSLAQLFVRALLSYGFYAPFVAKLQNTAAFTGWLSRMHFPAPELNAWLVIGLQGAAIALLLIGFATRFLAALLAFHMAIGLLAVHWPHGFSAVEHGYEIPLYYVLLLVSLIVYGAGRWSVDGWVRSLASKYS